MTRTHLTHATDRTIDNERAKVVNDLAFTGCVDSGSLVSRTFLKQLEKHGSFATVRRHRRAPIKSLLFAPGYAD